MAYRSCFAGFGSGGTFVSAASRARRVIVAENLLMVGGRADRVAIGALGMEMTKERALNMAAWIVALHDWDDEFPALLAAIRGEEGDG